MEEGSKKLYEKNTEMRKVGGKVKTVTCTPSTGGRLARKKWLWFSGTGNQRSWKK